MTDPIVTDGELDLDLIAPPDRWLSFSFVVRAEDGDLIVGREKLRVAVPGSLSVPQMAKFLRLESRTHEALADGLNGDEILEATVVAAALEIADVIAELNPGLFAPFDLDTSDGPVRARRRLELTAEQTIVSLAWLAGGGSVADEVAKALTAGAATAEAAQADDGRADGDGNAEGGAPFGSPLNGPLSSISSGSDGSTVGSPVTGFCREDLGPASPGASSEATFLTPIAA